jgi:very-short-patch-repair endonuclease
VASKPSWNKFQLWFAKLEKGTPAELNIEPFVAKLGIPYRFQKPFWGGPYFADFAFPTLMVILEIDGAEHRTVQGRIKDAQRTAYLEKNGWEVVRCTNEEALYQPEETIERLLGYRVRKS